MPGGVCVTCGWRWDCRKAWHNRLRDLVLAVGVFYTLYSIYYALLRLDFSTERVNPLPLSKLMWQRDDGLKRIHDRVTQGNLPPDVTVITAYFNLGKFTKGSLFSYTPSLYARWMTVFARLNNPLIVFTDSKEAFNLLTSLRKNFASNQSKIIMVSRKRLWSFSLAKEIQEIFHQPDYPVFQPNTVNENYSCVMHAKFELVNKVIREKLYHTKYLSWLDIGLFRDIATESKSFPIQVPPGWDENKVAYSQVMPFDPLNTAEKIIFENQVWVCGAMFLGRPEVLFLFTEDYMKAISHLIDQKLMSTDQQVLYIMYLPSFYLRPRVQIQTYTTYSRNDWFYLGYLIKELWDRKQREMTPLVQFFLSGL